ncbi:rDNA transcriptional regulator pol5 like protein [Verticillium longisporum]|uniref:rDNA transcriptional regulator pol5 like protein n=1 Tax=Verticillium longisporum TaxID=100787 RepID=A0A8I2ZG54_VERLO|nr:rDNA transcriptional regulator pol5 like protein [Verticillium longisporum]RBQ92602.1 hypothetical protein VDGD_10356 [Verticillium dahliae]
MTRTASAKRKRAEREALKELERATKRTKSGDPEDLYDKKLFVEKSAGGDRVREARLYELLGSEDSDERVVAAETVISSLLDGDGVPEDVLKRHLDWRLFRGLASGRAGARLGYSLVITEILRQLFGGDASSASRYPGLTFDKVLDILHERTNPTGHMTGQEERDFYFGKLFGLDCFVRAGFMDEDLDKWDNILQQLLDLADRKVWLRSHCGWVVMQAVPKLKADVVASIIKKLKAAKWTKTPEGVGIWLAALETHPELEGQGVENPLDPKVLPNLPAILKDSLSGEEAEEESAAKTKKKTANWSHQLHFVWPYLLGYYVSKGAVTDFVAFWRRAVDDNLFIKSASDGQKLRGFVVLQTLLMHPLEGNESTLESFLPHMFSKNLMTCLMNQAASEGRYLHRAACATLRTVAQAAQRSPEFTSIMIENLTTNNGVYNFDVRTGAKTIETILQRIKPDVADDVVGVLSAPVIKSCTTGKDMDKVKVELRAYVEYLFKMATAAPEAALQELASLAYAPPIWVPENASEFVKDLSRNRLQSVFANLSKKAEDTTYLCTAIEAISPDYIQMDAKLKKAVADARKKLKALLQTALAKPAADGASDEMNVAKGLSLLYAIAIFQLYNAEPDALQLLDDLRDYQSRMKTDEDKAAEFLIEILLSMASQDSVLLRQISQQVFGCFASRVTSKALELLLDVLSADENAKGQQSLFDIENDDMDLEDFEEEEDDEDEDNEDDEDDDVEEINVDDDSELEIDSGVQFVTLNAADGASEDKEGEDRFDAGSEDEAAEDEDAEEVKNLEAIDDALGKILNSHRLDKDADASDSDTDMTDSEMLALDEKLSAVFKDRIKTKPSKKKERKAAKESVINFKRRVLSLLEIYIRSEAGSPIAIAALLPLVQLIRTTTVKSLSDRSLELTKEYQKQLKKVRAANKKQKKTVQVDAEATLQLLKDIHAEAAASEMNDHAKAAAAASLIVGSTLFIADQASRPAVEAEFAKLERKPEKKGRKSNKKKKAGEIDMAMDWKNWRQNYEAVKRQ